MPDSLERRIRAIVGDLVGRTLAHTPISPDALTLTSPLFMIGVLVLLANAQFFWGGVLLLFASAFDMLDGALARARGTTSKLGAFLDSTLDRYSDALAFGGLALYYARVAPSGVESVLVYVALVGSLLTSYARARAEALGFDGKVGWLERPERVLLLGAGLLTGWLTPVLWVLAVLTHVTVIQRIAHVWRQARQSA